MLPYTNNNKMAFAASANYKNDPIMLNIALLLLSQP